MLHRYIVVAVVGRRAAAAIVEGQCGHAATLSVLLIAAAAQLWQPHLHISGSALLLQPPDAQDPAPDALCCCYHDMLAEGPRLARSRIQPIMRCSFCCQAKHGLQ